MTQEDKELLLKDLCARLPYGVKVEITHWRNRDKGMIDSKIFRVPLDVNKASVLIKPTSDVIPYLFPLSSMTEEQYKEIWHCMEADNKETLLRARSGQKCANPYSNVADYYNANHFDYRGLIEKGLAIDATGLNIY